MCSLWAALLQHLLYMIYPRLKRKKWEEIHKMFINIWYAIIAGTTIILGAFYMLRMFQKSMLGENTKTFKDISISESIVLIVIVGVTIFFGLFPQPIIDLIEPSLQSILNQIN